MFIVNYEYFTEYFNFNFALLERYRIELTKDNYQY